MFLSNYYFYVDKHKLSMNILFVMDFQVWKFVGNPTARQCTLYSNFNLPPAVNITYTAILPATPASPQVLTSNPELGAFAMQPFPASSQTWHALRQH